MIYSLKRFANISWMYNKILNYQIDTNCDTLGKFITSFHKLTHDQQENNK